MEDWTATDVLALAGITATVLTVLITTWGRLADRRATERYERRKEAVDALGRTSMALASSPDAMIMWGLTSKTGAQRKDTLRVRFQRAEGPLTAIEIGHHDAACRAKATELSSSLRVTIGSTMQLIDATLEHADIAELREVALTHRARSLELVDELAELIRGPERQWYRPWS